MLPWELPTAVAPTDARSWVALLKHGTRWQRNMSKYLRKTLTASSFCGPYNQTQDSFTGYFALLFQAVLLGCEVSLIWGVNSERGSCPRVLCPCSPLQGGELTFEGFFQIPNFHKGVLSSPSLLWNILLPQSCHLLFLYPCISPMLLWHSNNCHCFSIFSFLKSAAFASLVLKYAAGLK